MESYKLEIKKSSQIRVKKTIHAGFVATICFVAYDGKNYFVVENFFHSQYSFLQMMVYVGAENYNKKTTQDWEKVKVYKTKKSAENYINQLIQK